MRITDVRTWLVGNPWKNWLFVRVDTDRASTASARAPSTRSPAPVEAAIHELPHPVHRARSHAYRAAPPAHGARPLLRGRTGPRGRLPPRSRSPAGTSSASPWGFRSMRCWVVASGDRVRAYANGWYRCRAHPESPSPRPPAASWARGGYGALKFDPFGSAWRSSRTAARRTCPSTSWPRGAGRGGPRGRDDDRGPQSLLRRDRPAHRRPASRRTAPTRFEEPVPHPAHRGHGGGSAPLGRCPSRRASRFSSVHQFADLLGSRCRASSCSPSRCISAGCGGRAGGGDGRRPLRGGDPG